MIKRSSRATRLNNGRTDEMAMEPRKACQLCGYDDDEPPQYGQLFRGEITVHHYCLLSAKNLEQRGRDDEGYAGFLFEDIRTEVNNKTQKCSYCHQVGARVQCSFGGTTRRCGKIFHFPCLVARHGIMQFFGEFRTLCCQHRPSQKNVISRLNRHLAEESSMVLFGDEEVPSEKTCPYCLEHIDDPEDYDNLVGPCCKHSIYHRECLQSHALSAGRYFFRCALCNNSGAFLKEMLRMGINVPIRDAAWELEAHAFEELNTVPEHCDAEICYCHSRDFVADSGSYCMKRCQICGHAATHVLCSSLDEESEWTCKVCEAMQQSVAPMEAVKPELPSDNADNADNASEYVSDGVFSLKSSSPSLLLPSAASSPSCRAVFALAENRQEAQAVNVFPHCISPIQPLSHGSSSATPRAFAAPCSDGYPSAYAVAVTTAGGKAAAAAGESVLGDVTAQLIGDTPPLSSTSSSLMSGSSCEIDHHRPGIGSIPQPLLSSSNLGLSFPEANSAACLASTPPLSSSSSNSDFSFEEADHVASPHTRRTPRTSSQQECYAHRNSPGFCRTLVSPWHSRFGQSPNVFRSSRTPSPFKGLLSSQPLASGRKLEDLLSENLCNGCESKVATPGERKVLSSTPTPCGETKPRSAAPGTSCTLPLLSPQFAPTVMLMSGTSPHGDNGFAKGRDALVSSCDSKLSESTPSRLPGSPAIAVVAIPPSTTSWSSSSASRAIPFRSAKPANKRQALAVGQYRFIRRRNKNQQPPAGSPMSCQLAASQRPVGRSPSTSPCQVLDQAVVSSPVPCSPHRADTSSDGVTPAVTISCILDCINDVKRVALVANTGNRRPKRGKPVTNKRRTRCAPARKKVPASRTVRKKARRSVVTAKPCEPGPRYRSRKAPARLASSSQQDAATEVTKEKSTAAILELITRRVPVIHLTRMRPFSR